MDISKNKHGYYFLIDALVGSIIILTTMVLVINTAIPASRPQYNYELAEDYGTLILNTKIEDLSNNYTDTLVRNGIIKNLKNTIIEQVDEFYYNAYYICPGIASLCATTNISYATNMIQNISEPVIPLKYGFSYRILDSKINSNVTLYNRSITTLNSSNLVIGSKKITFLRINSTTMFGPEIVEIRVWV